MLSTDYQTAEDEDEEGEESLEDIELPGVGSLARDQILSAHSLLLTWNRLRRNLISQSFVRPEEGQLKEAESFLEEVIPFAAEVKVRSSRSPPSCPVVPLLTLEVALGLHGTGRVDPSRCPMYEACADNLRGLPLSHRISIVSGDTQATTFCPLCSVSRAISSCSSLKTPPRSMCLRSCLRGSSSTGLSLTTWSCELMPSVSRSLRRQREQFVPQVRLDGS